jgi:hypothetical protein
VWLLVRVACFLLFTLRVTILSSGPDFLRFCQSVWLHILVNYWRTDFQFLIMSFLAEGCWSLRFCYVWVRFLENVGAWFLLSWTSPWLWCCAGCGVLPLLLVLLRVSYIVCSHHCTITEALAICLCLHYCGFTEALVSVRPCSPLLNC